MQFIDLLLIISFISCLLSIILLRDRKTAAYYVEVIPIYASKWFDFLKWLILIGTITIVALINENTVIQLFACFSYAALYMYLFFKLLSFAHNNSLVKKIITLIKKIQQKLYEIIFYIYDRQPKKNTITYTFCRRFTFWSLDNFIFNLKIDAALLLMIFIICFYFSIFWLVLRLHQNTFTDLPIHSEESVLFKWLFSPP